jgi:hypothetical protein
MNINYSIREMSKEQFKSQLESAEKIESFDNVPDNIPDERYIHINMWV